MTSALAQQLQQLSTRFGTESSSAQRFGKASLLFSAREAADIDLQTIYNIGLQGGDGVRQTASPVQCMLIIVISDHRDRDMFLNQQTNARLRKIHKFGASSTGIVHALHLKDRSS